MQSPDYYDPNDPFSSLSPDSERELFENVHQVPLFDDFFNMSNPMANPTITAQQVKPMEPLRIVAQPKAMYRERYSSEINDNPGRPLRFIRTEKGHPEKLDYPTVEIPEIWRNSNKKLYIRVTLVTVPNNNARFVCIHPYGIDAKEEDNVIKYPENPTQAENGNEHYYHWLFYPINNEELNKGRKSFNIIRKKMVQHHLKTYGPLQIYDSDDKDISRVRNTSNPKEVIDTYQLWRSKLVFTLVEYMLNNTLQLIPTTSVMSQMMCDEKIEQKYLASKRNSPSPNENSVRCAPVEGNWNGGDEVLMFIPKLDRRKAWSLYFYYGQQGGHQQIPIVPVDMKTISFKTPPCPLLTQNCYVDIPIIVIQNETIIAQVNFRYLAHKKNQFRFAPF